MVQKKGFTLIELLVVIAIIGMLSSVVLASLNKARIKARDAQRKSNVQAIVKALVLYYDQFGDYNVMTPGGNMTGYYYTVPNPAIGCASMTYGTSASSYRYSITRALADRKLMSSDVVDPVYGANSCAYMKYSVGAWGACIYTTLENTSDKDYDASIDPNVCGGDCLMRYRVCIQ